MPQGPMSGRRGEGGRGLAVLERAFTMGEWKGTQLKNLYKGAGKEGENSKVVRTKQWPDEPEPIKEGGNGETRCAAIRGPGLGAHEKGPKKSYAIPPLIKRGKEKSKLSLPER